MIPSTEKLERQIQWQKSESVDKLEKGLAKYYKKVKRMNIGKMIMINATLEK